MNLKRTALFSVVCLMTLVGGVNQSRADNLTFTTNCNNVWQDCCDCGPNLQINWPRACTPGVCPAAPGIGDVVTVSQDCTVGGAGFPDAVAGTLNHTAGTLNILGNLAIDSGGATFDGPVVLVNGSLARASGGNVFMSLNGGMIMSGGSEKYLGGNPARLLGGLTLFSESNITWTGSGNFIVGVSPGGAPSTLYINSGGLFDVQTDASLLTTQQFGFGRVINQGTIQKSAGNGTSTWNINLENFGLFDVKTGNVTLTGLGQSAGDSCEFRINAGSQLTFATAFGFEFKQGTRFTGDGEVVLVDTGSSYGVLVKETIDLNRLRITNSGDIGPDTNPGHINITDLLEVDGARIVPPVTIKTGARLEQNGANTSSFGDLTIKGNVDILSGTLATVDHTLTVQPGGVVEIRDNAALRTAGNVALPIQNNGTIQKTTGAGTAFVLADFFRSFFNNTGGLIHVAVGTLDFADSNIKNEGGTWQIDAGTTVKAPGSFGGVFELNSGSVRGKGTLLVRQLKNAGGVVAPGASAGILTVIGDAASGRPGDYLQQANGTLEIEVGGLTAGTQHDKLVAAGLATLGGTLKLNAINGFVPDDGDSITIIDAANSVGAFGAVELAGFPGCISANVAIVAGDVVVTFDGDSDVDGDGTPDCVDGCPNDGNKIAPGVCGCGLSDDDSDGDGEEDCNDGCPDDAAKTAAGECGCGVADVDGDGDGVLDCDDDCPDDADKTEQGECGCGEAETDDDDDGVPNCIDDNDDNNNNGNDNDNNNQNNNNQNGNDNQNDNDNPAPGPAPECGADACGGGTAAMAPLLIMFVVSAISRKRRR